MSKENVDRLRAAIEAFNERDRTKVDGLLAPDAEIVPVRAAVEGPLIEAGTQPRSTSPLSTTAGSPSDGKSMNSVKSATWFSP